MSQPYLRRLAGDKFIYKVLHNSFEEGEMSAYREQVMARYAKLTKKWDDDLNSEWVARMYLSAKMIYSAELLLNTSAFCADRNVKITDPYLLYYALFCCCRALNYTDPTLDWKEGSMINDNHKRVITNTVNILKRINKNKAADLGGFLYAAKEYREMFSYHFPASGFPGIPIFGEVNLFKVADVCRLICELAQQTSTYLESSWDKHNSTQNYSLNHELLLKCARYAMGPYTYTDEEDWRRIDYLQRKVNRPFSIYYTMSEGLTDDFFGAWHLDNDPKNFDPDDHEIKIFQMP